MGFKVTIEQVDLANGLRKVRSTLGKGKEVTAGTANTDNCVYMEVMPNPAKGPVPMLKMITNNGNELTESFVEIIDGEVGVSALVEYNKLASMVDTIDPTIEIKMSSDDSKLLLNYVGRSKPIVFNGIDHNQFLMPPDVQIQDTITVPLGALKDGLDSISALITDSQARPLYNCANIEVKAGKITFGGLDAAYSRIMYYSQDITHTNEGKFFVECNKLKKMLSAFDQQKDVDILISGNNIAFEQDDVKQSIRLISGSFPDVISIIKTQYVVEAEAIKDDLLIAIERSKVLAESNSATGRYVVFNFDENFITINLNSQFGFLFETVPCKLKGKPFSMAFRIESLYEAIKLIKDTTVRLGFSSRSGGVLSPIAPTGFEQLIFVPAVRIANEEVK